MGLLVDGHWQDKWYESSKDGAFQRENRRSGVTGSPLTASRGRAVKAVLPLKPDATTSTCPSPARGHTAR